MIALRKPEEGNYEIMTVIGLTIAILGTLFQVTELVALGIGLVTGSMVQISEEDE